MNTAYINLQNINKKKEYTYMIIYTLGILEKNSKILFLLRQNSSFCDGYYGLPGGKKEPHESPTDALIRELHEELGLTLTQNNLQFVHCLVFKNAHNIPSMALFFKVIDCNDNPINQEPHKCTQLNWFAPNELPENVIPRHRQIITMLKQGIMYIENE